MLKLGAKTSLLFLDALAANMIRKGIIKITFFLVVNGLEFA
jgi:hypothetical protein